ncbi:MAG: hypothetical protein LBB48_05045 [Treponema sp.]|jgi:hypothetical protein|nr:hypothetical protein [Treponema sp.]
MKGITPTVTKTGNYLQSLTKEFGIDRSAVSMISDMLGPSENFDGLVSPGLAPG